MPIRRGASKGVPVAPAKKKHKRLPLKQILHLAHRTLIFLSAISYIKLSFDSAVAAVGLLRGRDDPLLPTDENTYDLMAAWVGTTTVRESPLVKQSLQGHTAPVNGTLYLHSSAETSFTVCSSIPEIQQEIYQDSFQRSLYEALVRGASYHITELSANNMELIAPVVDCTSNDMSDGDSSSSRFYYLGRRPTDTSNVSLIIISLSNQPYEVAAQGEIGPAGVATIQIIYDLSTQIVQTFYALSVGYPFEYFDFRAYEYVNTTSTNFWTLQSVPADDIELVRLTTTANREGFYIKAESEQSNINVQVWEPDTDPLKCVSRWRWTTKPVVSDSWAWVHVAQFYIGARLLANLFILCTATFQNIRAGKWWVGDAFVAVSTSQLANGALLLFSWFMNEYWVLHEFSFSIADEVSGITEIFIDTGPVQAGLLTMYFSASGIIGYLMREKIDPFFTMICYSIGFELRVKILKAIPSLTSSITEYATYSYMRGVSEPLDGQIEISPMRMWTTHAIGTRNYSFVFKCLFPIYGTLAFVVVYALVRKVYWRIYPETIHNHQNTTATRHSGKEESTLAHKRVLTLFEVATGAELENRFGMVSDYETCLFIKGMKFASADGIYSTGFVIANKKYLLQTRDYWSIVLMKLLRRRYTNIYVYEVNGNTVQQMARLVYPNTLTFQDLAHVNVGVLS